LESPQTTTGLRRVKNLEHTSCHVSWRRCAFNKSDRATADRHGAQRQLVYAVSKIAIFPSAASLALNQPWASHKSYYFMRGFTGKLVHSRGATTTLYAHAQPKWAWASDKSHFAHEFSRSPGAKPFFARIYRKNAAPQDHDADFRASLPNRNGQGHLTRAISRKNLQEKMPRPKREARARTLI